MPNLTGKVAIVTGAGRGIGRAHALALAEAGARVVVNDLGGSLAGQGNDLTPAQQVVEEIERAGGEAAANGANVADFAQAGEMIETALGTFGANYGAAKAGIAGFTLIVAQELQRYGVTVNCLAPNARTRMTEDTFDMGAPPEGFDPLDPSNMSPLVVALSADDAQGITGQVFHVWGGAINALQGWTAGELFERNEKWDADALLGELVERFPDGAAPAGMMAGMQAAGGRSLRAQ